MADIQQQRERNIQLFNFLTVIAKANKQANLPYQQQEEGRFTDEEKNNNIREHLKTIRDNLLDVGSQTLLDSMLEPNFTSIANAAEICNAHMWMRRSGKKSKIAKHISQFSGEDFDSRVMLFLIIRLNFNETGANYEITPFPGSNSSNTPQIVQANDFRPKMFLRTQSTDAYLRKCHSQKKLSDDRELASNGFCVNPFHMELFHSAASAGDDDDCRGEGKTQAKKKKMEQHQKIPPPQLEPHMPPAFTGLQVKPAEMRPIIMEQTQQQLQQVLSPWQWQNSNSQIPAGILAQPSNQQQQATLPSPQFEPLTPDNNFTDLPAAANPTEMHSTTAEQSQQQFVNLWQRQSSSSSSQIPAGILAQPPTNTFVDTAWPLTPLLELQCSSSQIPVIQAQLSNIEVSGDGQQEVDQQKQLQMTPATAVTFQSLQTGISSSAAAGDDLMTLDLDKLLGQVGQKQQLQKPTIIQLISGGQQQLYYNHLRINNATNNKFLLRDDLQSIISYLQRRYQFPDMSKLISAVSDLDIHLFDTIKYAHSCSCGDNDGTTIDYGAGGGIDDEHAHYACTWSNSNIQQQQIFHFLFDYFTRLGWLDPIAPADAQLHQIAVCPLGRGIQANGFEYMIKACKFNPYGPRMDIVRRLLKRPTLREPDDCEFCPQKFERNGAHMMSNLLMQFGIATDSELREYSSWNCVGGQSDTGLPIRARDLLDFFMFSGKFIAYGPMKDLPANRWVHSRSNQVFTEFGRLNIKTVSELADNQLCFIFCRRRSETIPTKGNSSIFGTKTRTFIGLSVYSECTHDHWYFVPKLFLQTMSRPLPIVGRSSSSNSEDVHIIDEEMQLPQQIRVAADDDENMPQEDEYLLETP